MIKLTRVRYAITRNNTDIFCGLSRHFEFRPSDDIGDAAIKTYLSERAAIASFNKSWSERYDGQKYKTIKVVESIIEWREDPPWQFPATHHLK